MPRDCWHRAWNAAFGASVLAVLWLVHDNARLAAQVEEATSLQKAASADWAVAYARLNRELDALSASASESRSSTKSTPSRAEEDAMAMLSHCRVQLDQLQARLVSVGVQQQQQQQRQRCPICAEPTEGSADSLLALRNPKPVSWGTVRSSYRELDRNIWLVWGLWDSSEMPPQAAEGVKRFEKLNPGWTVRVVGPAYAEQLLNSSFPEAVDVWRKAAPVVRGDLLRLLLVMKHGGLYADVDSIFRSGVEDILRLHGFDVSRHDALFFTETVLEVGQMYDSARVPLRNGVPEIGTRVANYAFYARAGSDVMRNLVTLALYRLARLQTVAAGKPRSGDQGPHGGYDVLYAAGPDCVTEAVWGGEGTALLPRVVLAPFESPNAITNHGMGTWREPGSQWRQEWSSLKHPH
eukprot:TRINITY_DN1968_c6_g1_i1.p1 TRINITY_DN1968_c6_g1~~TRINITY_DN1968_c6_g1_i1.p1  ORF type:complete len:408 (+),score=120.37 TRINITY_DN1968_c6_g1_i1:55-1278(+)